MKIQIAILLLAISAASEALELNVRSIQLIKSYESWRSCAYFDAVNKLTIGYGHLVKPGEPYKIGVCITLAEGETVFKKDVYVASSCIDRIVKVSLNTNEYGALTSWTYNVGCGNAQSFSHRVRTPNFGK